MSNKFSRVCLELIQWRDEEIKSGNMEKAKRIQKIIRRKKGMLKLYIYNNMV